MIYIKDSDVISTRTANLLEAQGIHTAEQLMHPLTLVEVYRIRGLGRIGFREVKKFIKPFYSADASPIEDCPRCASMRAQVECYRANVAQVQDILEECEVLESIR